MEDKKIDLLKQMLREIEDSITNYLRKSGINGRAILRIKPDKNFPNKYFTKEEILTVVNELCMARHGVIIQDPNAKSANMLYRKIFFKIYYDMGHSYNNLKDVFIIEQNNYNHHIKSMNDFLEDGDGPIVDQYREVLETLNKKYSVGYETDDEDTPEV